MSKKLPITAKLLALVLVLLGFTSAAQAQSVCYVDLAAPTLTTTGSVGSTTTVGTQWGLVAALTSASCPTVALETGTYSLAGQSVTINQSKTIRGWDGTNPGFNAGTAPVLNGGVVVVPAGVQVSLREIVFSYVSEDGTPGTAMTVSGSINGQDATLAIGEGSTNDTNYDLAVTQNGSIVGRNFNVIYAAGTEVSINGQVNLRGTSTVTQDGNTDVGPTGSITLNDQSISTGAGVVNVVQGSQVVFNRTVPVTLANLTGYTGRTQFVFLGNTRLDLTGAVGDPFPVAGGLMFEFRGANEIDIPSGVTLTDETFMFTTASSEASINILGDGGSLTLSNLIVDRPGSVNLTDDVDGSATSNFFITNTLDVNANGTVDVGSNNLVFQAVANVATGSLGAPMLDIDGTITGTTGTITLNVVGSQRFRAMGDGTIDVLTVQNNSTSFGSGAVFGNEVEWTELLGVTVNGGAMTLPNATELDGIVVVDGPALNIGANTTYTSIFGGDAALIANVLDNVTGTVDILQGTFRTYSGTMFEDMVRVYGTGRIDLLDDSDNADPVVFDEMLTLDGGAVLNIERTTTYDVNSNTAANRVASVQLMGGLLVNGPVVINQVNTAYTTGSPVISTVAVSDDITLNASITLARLVVMDNIDLDRVTGNTTAVLTITRALVLENGNLDIEEDEGLNLSSAVLISRGGRILGEEFTAATAPLQVNYVGDRSITTGLEISGGVGTVVVNLTPAGDPLSAQLVLSEDITIRDAFVFLSGRFNLNTYDVTLGDSDTDEFTFVRGDAEFSDTEGGSSVMYAEAASRVNLVYVNRINLTTQYEWPAGFRVGDVVLRNYFDIAGAHGNVMLAADRQAVNVNALNGTLNIGAYVLDLSGDLVINGPVRDVRTSPVVPGIDPLNDLLFFGQDIGNYRLPVAVAGTVANFYKGQVISASPESGLVRFTGTGVSNLLGYIRLDIANNVRVTSVNVPSVEVNKGSATARLNVSLNAADPFTVDDNPATTTVFEGIVTSNQQILQGVLNFRGDFTHVNGEVYFNEINDDWEDFYTGPATSLCIPTSMSATPDPEDLTWLYQLLYGAPGGSSQYLPSCSPTFAELVSRRSVAHFSYDVMDDFTQRETADLLNDGGALIYVGGDLRLEGTAETVTAENVVTSLGTGAINILRGAFVMDGNDVQNVFQRMSRAAWLHNFGIAKTTTDISKDVVLLSNLHVGAGYISMEEENLTTGQLALVEGNIETGANTLYVENPVRDQIIANDVVFGAIIFGGANSFVEGFLNRDIVQGGTTGGEVESGYRFPVGIETAEAQYFRPLTLQLPNNLGNTRNVTVSAWGVMPESNDGLPINTPAISRDQNINLALNRKAQAAWCVTFNQNPALNPNIRLGVQGLVGINDIDRLRIIAAPGSCANGAVTTTGPWRLAGTYDLAVGGPDDTFNPNDYIDGIPTLIQEGVQLWSTTNQSMFPLTMVLTVASQGNLDPIVIGQNPVAGPVASVQIINAIPDAAQGKVDVYINGFTMVTLPYLQATSFTTLPASATIRVFASGADTTTASPLMTNRVNLAQNGANVFILSGTVATTDNVPVTLFTKADAREEANDSDNMEAFFYHAVPGGPAVDITELNEMMNNAVARKFANNLMFNQATGYWNIAPGALVLSVENADANNQLINVYRFALEGKEGETFTVLVAPMAAGATGVQVVAFDANGQKYVAQITTDVELADSDLPTEFTLKGNYPNPFNPSTTINFDLPATAEVSIEVIDMLGRRVMTVPVQSIAAGASRSVMLDASNLSSGTYLYRVTAKMANATKIQTGRMTLVK